ncbi:hypothetical protein [Winogradskyella ursingii]|uniref:hypothetical protein n=1 Tax=Winogradskyella ursingii TaxID=2686079 RepID=UPI0015C6B3DE|nr:hypothetical protein [Winogradskyella ursingii]
MKTIIYTLIFAFTLQLSAQDPILQTDDESIEERAAKITDKYDEQIELDAKQNILFKKKVEQFLQREEKIRANYKGKAMLNEIKKLRIAETMEMRNVLTRPQLELYKKLKPKIQPLGYVDEKEE